jgi:hypothetical protein
MNHCHIQCSLSVTVSTSGCLVAASNGGRFPSSVFPNCPRPQLPDSHSNSSQRLNYSSPLSNSLTHQPITTTKSKSCYDRRPVGQSVLMPSTHLGPKTRFYYCQRVADLLMRGALSDERRVLSFTIAAGPRQHSHTLIYGLWTLTTILLHEFYYNFGDGHYSVFFWVGPTELGDCCSHWHLLVVPQGRG